VELLTLSACQTAEGDDRSPLGLTGVAIQSGARSALGSLWPVSDQATQRLLTGFYRHLLDPALSKAESLQRAQRELLAEPEFRHPFFWSAFILVGNWL
jgi:CHAT domain-containing protein